MRPKTLAHPSSRRRPGSGEPASRILGKTRTAGRWIPAFAGMTGTLLVFTLPCTRAHADPALHDPIADMIAECPKGTDDAIVVCGRDRRREAERYRLPLRIDHFDPDGPLDSVSRERHRMYEVGETGTGSCSPAGAGGWTGCMIQDWHHNKEQHGH